MNNKQKQQIRELVRLRTTAYTAVLAELARATVLEEVKRTLKLTGRPQAIGNVASRTPEEITDSVLKDYLSNLNKGGTPCVERIIQPNDNGTYTCTTEQQFIPWLNDLSDETANDIIDLIGQSEMAGVYPLDIAKQIEGYMEGTKHRAVTAARTEAQKLRSDARFQTFVDQGVQYVQYVTVGDDAVRPEHAMRDGKIYRIEDAPYLGEYNCRCTVTPADYKVKMKGAEVEPNDAITLTEEELTGQQPVKPAQQTKVETPKQTREILQQQEAAGKIWQEFTDEDMANIKTYEQLEQAMANRWGLENITIDKAMEGIELQVIKDNVLAADKLVTDLKLQNLIYRMSKEKSSTKYMACGTTNGPARLYWYDLMADNKTAAEAYARNVKSGYHPAGTTYADVMTHEMAHAVEWRICQLTYPSDSLAFDAWDKSKVAAEIINEATKVYRKTTNIKGSKKDLVKTNISRYGGKSDSEALAEAFAAYYANGDKANNLSKLIVSITKDKLKAVEGGGEK